METKKKTQMKGRVDKRGKNKTKKNNKTALPTLKLRNANDNTIVTYGNYIPQQLYSYKVQYNDESQQKYTPFVLEDQFLPRFRLPTGVTSSVDAMCMLYLPDSIIGGIVHQSNMYSLARTKLEKTILVDSVVKKNPRWMHPRKCWDINRQDILFFFAFYYYMGYCRLPARRDY